MPPPVSLLNIASTWLRFDKTLYKSPLFYRKQFISCYPWRQAHPRAYGPVLAALSHAGPCPAGGLPNGTFILRSSRPLPWPSNERFHTAYRIAIDLPAKSFLSATPPLIALTIPPIGHKIIIFQTLLRSVLLWILRKEPYLMQEYFQLIPAVKKLSGAKRHGPFLTFGGVSVTGSL